MWSGQAQHLPRLLAPHPLQQLVLLPTPNLLAETAVDSPVTGTTRINLNNPDGLPSSQGVHPTNNVNYFFDMDPMEVIEHVDHPCKLFLLLSTKVHDKQYLLRSCICDMSQSQHINCCH